MNIASRLTFVQCVRHLQQLIGCEAEILDAKGAATGVEKKFAVAVVISLSTCMMVD